MLKLLEKFTAQDGSTVEIFKTQHSGFDFHVRYGLQVTGFNNLNDAQTDFDECVDHLRVCNL